MKTRTQTGAAHWGLIIVLLMACGYFFLSGGSTGHELNVTDQRLNHQEEAIRKLDVRLAELEKRLGLP